MPQYDIQIHPKAHSFLESHPEKNRLTSVLQSVASERKPTDHSKCTILSNNQRENIYKIRIGNYRAIAVLEKPNLNILKIEQRQGAYDNIEEVYAEL